MARDALRVVSAEEVVGAAPAAEASKVIVPNLESLQTMLMLVP